MSFERRALRLDGARSAGANDIVVTVAADFLRGGEPYLRAPSTASALLSPPRLKDEPWRAFEVRRGWRRAR